MSELFQAEVKGMTFHFDPLQVRRLLLQHSDGRCWTYIKDLQQFKIGLEALQVEEAKADNTKEQQLQLEALVAINLKSTATIEGLLATAAREAFDFQPVDPETGQGISEEICLRVLSEFMEYAEGKE